MQVASVCNRLHKGILRRVVPDICHPQDVYRRFLDAYVTVQSLWLDIGCGHSILPTWRRGYLEEEKRLASRCRGVVGLDYDHQSLMQHQTIHNKVRADIAVLPFASNSFELVTANMVVEHLRDPEKQFQEIHRVLKPGGRFIFHTPNAYSYYVLLARSIPRGIKPKIVSLIDTRPEEDIFPTFYRANSAAKIHQLAASSGFEVEEFEMVVSFGEAMLILVPPLDLLQILWIKLLKTNSLRFLRTNIIAVMRKPDAVDIS